MTPPRQIPALERLVVDGRLTAKESADVLLRAATENRRVDEVLREIIPGVDTPGSLAFEFVDLSDIQIDRAAVMEVPESLARKHGVLPVGFSDERLIVALSDANVIVLDDLRTATGRELLVVLAEPAAIHAAWVRLGTLEDVGASLRENAPTDEDEAHPELDSAADAPIVRAINEIIAQAVQQNASDIHIEPQELEVLVRFRLDGVLHDILHIPRSFAGGISSRLKIMADLDISERRLPQDGRMSFTVDGQSIDLRIATVPSVWGEEVILRVLDRSSLLTLTDLGFPEDTRAQYEMAFQKPHGAILVVGPTGSGKSTTLYSTLSVVNDIERKIITVEDPVELRLPRVTQIHVNHKAGLSFARALRSILRSDPDVVMIGEIRDVETARIAIEAAMSGHVVFSTLHTNDAPSAIARLVEMGLEPFLVASALEGVLAQRLARKLCSRCKEPYTPAPDVLRSCGIDSGGTFYRAVGCNRCAMTGYSGRVALVELMLITEEIERLTVERRSSDDLRRAAVEQGMRTLREDGVQKAQEGITSLEEVLRVLDGRSQKDRGADAPDERRDAGGIVQIRRVAG